MTATAGFDVPQRRLHPAGAFSDARPDVVVRLHRDHAARPRSAADTPGTPIQPVPMHPVHANHAAPADLDQLTRAVHAVVEALAPGVHAEISVVETGSSGGPGTSGEAGAELLGDEHIRLDPRSRTLTVDGEPVSLTKREFELLAHLAQHQGLALSRRELMNAVWHERYLPGDRTVDVHVRRVRVKLGVHADRLTTLRGFGYRFD